MLNNVKQWDAPKIKQMFTHDAVKEILNVPLLEDVGEDYLVQKEEQNGIYSDKIGHNFLCVFKVNKDVEVLRVTDVVCGRLEHHQNLSTYFGELVSIASQLEFDFVNIMLYVLLFVNYVKEGWKMSDMYYLDVQ